MRLAYFHLAGEGVLVDNSFRLGDWVVEPDLNQVVGSAGPIKLKPRVMHLLVYLAESCGESRH